MSDFPQPQYFKINKPWAKVVPELYAAFQQLPKTDDFWYYAKPNAELSATESYLKTCAQHGYGITLHRFPHETVLVSFHPSRLKHSHAIGEIVTGSVTFPEMKKALEPIYPLLNGIEGLVWEQ